MSLFNANWRTQVTNLLPSFLRSVSLIDYITALIEPVATKSTTFEAFDNDVNDRARFNGQIVILRAALNKLFGVTSAPLIDIETVENYATIGFIYNEAEDADTIFIYNSIETTPMLFVYNDLEIGDMFAFTVKIPTGIHTAELERRIRSEVQLYKASGLTFNIITY